MSQPVMVAVSVYKRRNDDYLMSWFSGKWLSAGVSIGRCLVFACVSSDFMHFGVWGKQRELAWWVNLRSGLSGALG